MAYLIIIHLLNNAFSFGTIYNLQKGKSNLMKKYWSSQQQKCSTDSCLPVTTQKMESYILLFFVVFLLWPFDWLDCEA